MIDIVSYSGDYTEVDRWVREVMDKYADRVIEVRYIAAMRNPRQLTAEIVYRLGG